VQPVQGAVYGINALNPFETKDLVQFAMQKTGLWHAVTVAPALLGGFSESYSPLDIIK
jgi:homoserine kinase